MTQQQIELLKRLIAADRTYRTKLAAGELAHRDERGIEIGWINGVNPRTADALCEAGLAEIVNIRGDQSWLFLGAYDPYDPVS